MSQYEYYYVYYDEDGNVVDKSPPKNVDATKLQDIPIVTNNNVVSANNPNAEQTGDTPTIYASLSNNTIDDNSENEKASGGDNENEDGLSIFGIPIPKIPFPILSFGLAPTTLSHGLLPIGRKGEPTSEGGSTDTNRRKTTNQEITRGPDTIDPIWLETLVNGAKYLIGNDGKSKASEDRVYETPTVSEAKLPNDRLYGTNQYYPEDGDNNKYIQPQNPVIPLTSSAEQPYYPPTNVKYPVPAIKFDHPVQINGLQHPKPISPAPGLQPDHPVAGSVGINTPASEDGFIPLFYPDKNDPVYTNVRGSQGYQLQQNYQELPPEGYTLPHQYPKQPSLNFEYPLVYPKPPQQLPEREIPIVYSKNPYMDEDLSKEVYPTQYITEDRSSDTPIEYVTTQAPNQGLVNVKDILNLDSDYYYAYEDIPSNYQVSSLEDSITESSSTTERKVPTLQVEEVLPDQNRKSEFAVPEVTTKAMTTEKEPATEVTSEPPTAYEQTEPSNVVYEYEYYYEYYDDPNSVNVDANDTEIVSEIVEDTTEAASNTQASFSLQNILSLITNSVQPTEISTIEKADLGEENHKAEDKEPTMILPMDQDHHRLPKEHPAPPIRLMPTKVPTFAKEKSTKETPSSTQNLINYLENQRSRVTVDTTPINSRTLVASGRSTTASVLGGPGSSTPYPFYPDRRDPAQQGLGDNEVKWYYSNYHSENLEPYIDPRLPRQDSEAAKVQSSASTLSLNLFLFIIAFALY